MIANYEHNHTIVDALQHSQGYYDLDAAALEMSVKKLILRITQFEALEWVIIRIKNDSDEEELVGAPPEVS